MRWLDGITDLMVMSLNKLQEAGVGVLQFMGSQRVRHDPMDCSTPGLPVHPVGDAIQPSHPLSSPSPPAFNLSQHQGLFK